MKKNLLVLALALIGASACPFKAYAHTTEEEANIQVEEEQTDNELGLSIEVGADVVTSYLWRGLNLGGLAIQPSFTIDWKGWYLSAWGNIGPTSWLFQEFNPELDITIGYANHGFVLDLTHLYYFYGNTYFIGLEDANNLSSSTMELHAGIDISEWAEKVPLTIDWYTTVLGQDPALDANGQVMINKNGNIKRAYSTYIELGYDIYLPWDIVLGLKLGFTPWKGMYSDYEEVWTNGRTIGFNNIQLRAEREFEINDLYISVWGEAMFNCYGVNKNNIINTFGNAGSQKLNACIGVGIYYGNEW